MFLLLLLAAALPAAAEHRLYACMINSRDYVVGARLPASGLVVKSQQGWQHVGYNHPQISALEYDPRNPAMLFLAAGNGCIRAANHGRDWRILTGHEVTELRDIAIDPNQPDTIYIAHTAGIRVTRDAGATWQDADRGLPRKFTKAIRVDRARAGYVVAGTETGLFHTADAGRTWTPAGASGLEVMSLEQSPHSALDWLAVTEQGGVFRSLDGGRSFENFGDVGVERNLYSIAFDPTRRGRIAVAGWGPGVAVTEDDGKTWQPRNAGLPRTDVWSVVFDPAAAGRLYAGVHEEALFVSDDAGRHWRLDGLEGSIVYQLRFVPSEARR